MAGRGGYGASQTGVPSEATGPGTVGSPIQSGANAIDYASFVNGADYFLNPDRFYESLNNFAEQQRISAQSYFDSLRDKNSGKAYFDKIQELADQGNEAAIEWMAKYYADIESEKSAREYNDYKDSHAYQTLIKDLQAAGVSPYILSGATPSVSSTSGIRHSGSELASYANSKRSSDTQYGTTAIQSILRILGITLSAILLAA